MTRIDKTEEYEIKIISVKYEPKGHQVIQGIIRNGKHRDKFVTLSF